MHIELELAKGYIREKRIYDKNTEYENMLSDIQIVMLYVTCEIKKE